MLNKKKVWTPPWNTPQITYDGGGTPYKVSFPIPESEIEGYCIGAGAHHKVKGSAMIKQNHLVAAQRPEIWDAFREVFKVDKPDKILELGTGCGALAMFFRDELPDVPIITVDISAWPCYDYMFSKADIDFRMEDYRTDPSLIEFVKADGKTFIICDNGNKPQEVAYFAPHMKQGDVIMAHDYVGYPDHYEWGASEITDQSVAEAVRECNLKPYQYDTMGKVVWLSLRKANEEEID